MRGSTDARGRGRLGDKMSAAKLPIAYSQYGSSMGRRSTRADPGVPIKFHLRRMYLDSGGYDSGGAYWGHGAPMYHAEGHGPYDDQTRSEEYAELFFRAGDRDHAKTIVRAQYPGARFYR